MTMCEHKTGTVILSFWRLTMWLGVLPGVYQRDRRFEVNQCFI